MYINNIKKKLFTREVLLYIFFGITTTIVGIIIFQGLLYFSIDYKIANLFSLIFGKLYAYIMNKFFVFKSKNKNFMEFCKEFIRFLISRGITAVIDYFGVILAVELFNCNKIISKYFFMILVIILNYFFGKKIVFKNFVQ